MSLLQQRPLQLKRELIYPQIDHEAAGRHTPHAHPSSRSNNQEVWTVLIKAA